MHASGPSVGVRVEWGRVPQSITKPYLEENSSRQTCLQALQMEWKGEGAYSLAMPEINSDFNISLKKIPRALIICPLGKPGEQSLSGVPRFYTVICQRNESIGT